MARNGVIFNGTYWIQSWSPLCQKEERGELKMGCRHMESAVLELFFKFGWGRCYRIED
ncbi:hypothetical protein BS78_04G070700 [Paspalum vaginatum]|nr:hypothetical protein BS78_04G070700 [Paspalum vaginatum]